MHEVVVPNRRFPVGNVEMQTSASPRINGEAVAATDSLPKLSGSNIDHPNPDTWENNHQRGKLWTNYSALLAKAGIKPNDIVGRYMDPTHDVLSEVAAEPVEVAGEIAGPAETEAPAASATEAALESAANENVNGAALESVIVEIGEQKRGLFGLRRRKEKKLREKAEPKPGSYRDLRNQGYTRLESYESSRPIPLPFRETHPRLHALWEKLREG